MVKIKSRRPKYTAIRALRGKSLHRVLKEMDSEELVLIKQFVDSNRNFFLGSSSEELKD